MAGPWPEMRPRSAAMDTSAMMPCIATIELRSERQLSAGFHDRFPFGLVCSEMAAGTGSGLHGRKQARGRDEVGLTSASQVIPSSMPPEEEREDNRRHSFTRRIHQLFELDSDALELKHQLNNEGGLGEVSHAQPGVAAIPVWMK